MAKVLQGTQPAHIPIERPTRLELALNLKTAKPLGSRSRGRPCYRPIGSSNDQSGRDGYADDRR